MHAERVDGPHEGSPKGEAHPIDKLVGSQP
jgi:hypothetical protein